MSEWETDPVLNRVQHFIMGMVLGFFIQIFVKDWKLSLFIGVLAGLLWEFIEYGGFYGFKIGDVADTLLDLVMDILGSIAVIFIMKRLKIP